MRALANETNGEAAPFLNFGEAMIDMAFAQMMAGMVADVEAGRSLRPMSSSMADWHPQGQSQSASARQSGEHRLAYPVDSTLYCRVWSMP